LPSEREILFTRSFAAPRALVFKAQTEPRHLERWWGPRDYVLTRCEMDFRPRGAWRFVQRGPDGREHAFRGTYREIAPPERIAHTFEYEPMPGYISLQTMTLEERNGRTEMTVLVQYWTAEDRDGDLHSGMEWGAGETFDRLDGYLVTLS
jgi:uncharacterized protein YndB with AHSA1/START domain